jgi:hypothetical protein
MLPGFEHKLLHWQEADKIVFHQGGHHQTEHEKKCSNCGIEYWIPAIKWLSAVPIVRHSSCVTTLN